MLNLTKFLKKTAKTTYDKIANIAIAFLVTTGITYLAVKFYSWLYETSAPTINSNLFGQWSFEPQYKHQGIMTLFFTCIMAPLIEEVVFRKFPMDIMKEVNKPKLIISTMLATSVIFALMHYGSYSIPIQGVLGLAASIVYVKNGYSYWSSVSLHALWNLSLFAGLLNF